VGDSLDAAMIQSLNQSVHTFDNHLNVSLVEVGPGQMVVRIYLPGKSDDREANAQSPKIRVGGNIQQTKLLVKQAPIYPPEAKEQRVQGLVRLEATIGKDGRIENLVVVSGEPILAAAAMEAVRNWQYAPTLLNGDPVEVVTTIDVNFTLSK
jgi:protein TonB